MPTFTNIRGTSEQHFRISLSGPTLYHGTAVPTATPPTSLDGGPLNPGDIYIRTDPANTGLFVLGSGGDNDWNEFLETGGGAAIIGGDLTVQGDLDTWGDIILLNSDLSALIGNIGGMEIGRNAAPNARWIWNDSLTQWEAASNPDTPALHNVYVENNLEVGGILTAPDGLAATPGIRFSAAGTGIYATATTLGFSTGGSSRWLIDATGNLLPAAAQNIGATGALAGSIYGTLFAGADGAVGAPTFTFDSDATTGMYHDAGAIVLSSGGAEVARVDTTEMELQGTLKITDGANNWTIDNDGADSNKLKLAYNTTDEAIITTSGELLIGDGSQANPAYSFISDDTIGMYFDGTDEIRFTVALGSDHLVISPTAINAPAATVTNPQDLTTKAYVDSVSGGSWREPVIVKEDPIYASLANAEAAMNSGSVDGVPVTAGDRILYTDIAGEAKNVFIIVGTPGAGATLLEDTNPVTHGDTVYVNEGTGGGGVFSYDVTNNWSEISATSGFGGTLYFNYEVQTAIGAQVVFTLSTIKYAPTLDGARLLVYVNGVKQVVTASYTETNETTVTFLVAPGVGKTVEFYAVGLATTDGVLKRETQTGLTGTPNPITFTTITYVPGQDGLLVFLNGQKMVVGTDYTELTSNTIQWITPALVVGDVLEFYSSVPIVAGVDLQDISNVSPVAPLNNEQLIYNATSGLWEPTAPGTSLGGLPHDYESDLSPAPDGIVTSFTTLNTSVLSYTGAPGARSYVQVFVNGVLQREGIGKDYTLGAPNTIIFVVAPAALDSIDIYQL